MVFARRSSAILGVEGCHRIYFGGREIEFLCDHFDPLWSDEAITSMGMIADRERG
jgi:hypothetical protein